MEQNTRRVRKSMMKESRKEDPKQGESKHTALFDATVDREFLRFGAVKLDRGLHVVVESHEDGQQRVWDKMERLTQQSKGSIKTT